jgi:hypothetical protein
LNPSINLFDNVTNDETTTDLQGVVVVVVVVVKVMFVALVIVVVMRIVGVMVWESVMRARRYVAWTHFLECIRVYCEFFFYLSFSSDW